MRGTVHASKDEAERKYEDRVGRNPVRSKAGLGRRQSGENEDREEVRASMSLDGKSNSLYTGIRSDI